MYIILVGAGTTGQRLAQKLSQTTHDIVVIDSNKNICEKIYNNLGILTINGDATDITTLENAGIANADYMISLMHSDSDNLACSILAKSYKVPNILVRMRIMKYEQAYKEVGVSFIAKVNEVLVNQFILEIEKSAIKTIFALQQGEVEIYTLTIPENAYVVGKKIIEIAKDQLPKDCLIIGITRGEDKQYLIPHGNIKLNANDEILLVSRIEYINEIFNYLTSEKKHKIKPKTNV